MHELSIYLYFKTLKVFVIVWLPYKALRKPLTVPCFISYKDEDCALPEPETL